MQRNQHNNAGGVEHLAGQRSNLPPRLLLVALPASHVHSAARRAVHHQLRAGWPG